MILEYCQMIVTARVLLGDLEAPIKYYTHRMRNHPCAVWVRTREGFLYTEELLWHLCNEFEYRWGKVHATKQFYFDLPIPNLETMFPYRRRRKPVALAVSTFPRFIGDPIKTYHTYYMMDKVRFATWTKRPKPSWWVVNNP